MIDRLFTGIVLFTCLSLLSACGGSATQPDEKTAKLEVGDSVVGKMIHMPDSLEVYVPFKEALVMDSAQLAQPTSFRVYAVVNVSCATCIPDIDKWNMIAPEFIKYGVPVVLICTTKNDFEYIKYLFESGKVKKFPFPLYLDNKGRFYKKNLFINPDISGQVVLVDHNSTIVKTGNPIESGKAKSAYLELIKNK